MNPKLKLILMITAVLIGSVIISQLVRKAVSTILKKNSETLKVDPTNYSFLKNASSLIIFTIALLILMYTIPEMRSFGTTIFASAGIFAAIIGFLSYGLSITLYITAAREMGVVAAGSTASVPSTTQIEIIALLSSRSLVLAGM